MKKMVKIESDIINEKFNEVVDYLEKKELKKILAKIFKTIPCPEDDPEKKAEMEKTAVRNCLVDTIHIDEDAMDAFSVFATELAFESLIPVVMPTEEDVENSEGLDVSELLKKAADALIDVLLEK